MFFDFSKESDIDRFDYYTSYEALPTFHDGAMYTYLYAEQKAILRNVALEEFLLEGDFGPSIYKGHIDTGFYIMATDPGSDVDSINAWEVNIEHDENVATWKLKLHRFQNYRWQGIYAEKADIPFWGSEWLHLSVLVKNGVVSAYINNDYSEPVISYTVGEGAGLVGVRNFKAPAKVKNISITSPMFTIDTNNLSGLVNECDALQENDYTPKSWVVLSDALLEANAVLADPINQLIVNDAFDKLQKAKDGLLLRKTYAELQTLIHECEQITDAQNYTANSWQSFVFCLNRAKQLPESSSVEEISYNYAILLDRKNELIRYGG